MFTLWRNGPVFLLSNVWPHVLQVQWGEKGLHEKGLAAKQYFDALCSVPASKLVVGDAVWMDGMFTKPGFYKVAAITSEISRGSSLVDGVMTPYENPTFSVHTAGGTHAGILDLTTKIFRKAQTKEAKKEKFAEALRYQATLTQKGVPSKRAAK